MPPQDLWYPQFTLGSWLSPLHNVPCITTIHVIFFVLASDHWYIIHIHWPWPFHLSRVSLSFHKIYDVLVEILLGYSENLSRRVNSTRLFKTISSITLLEVYHLLLYLEAKLENHATLLLSPLVVCWARDRLLHSIPYSSFPILFSSTRNLLVIMVGELYQACLLHHKIFSSSCSLNPLIGFVHILLPELPLS